MRVAGGPEGEGRSRRPESPIGLLRDLLTHLPWGSLGAARILLLVLLILFGGAWLFSRTAHVGYFKAVYWAVTTASTVGYGDIVPTNTASRLVAIGMMVLAVPLLGLVLANVASGLVEGRLRRVLGLGGVTLTRGDTLVLGWSAAAGIAVQDLLRRGHEVVVVADVDRLGLEAPHLRFVHGDPTDEALLVSLRPGVARAALLCQEHDGDILTAALSLHRLAPDLPLVAVPLRANTARTLRELGLAASFPSAELVGYALARGSETAHAAPLLWQLVSDDEHILRESPVTAAEVGQTVAAVRGQRATRGELVLGLLDGGTVRFGLTGQVLRTGESLLVLVRRDAPASAPRR